MANLTTVRVRKARLKTLKELGLPQVESVEVTAYGSSVAILNLEEDKVVWLNPELVTLLNSRPDAAADTYALNDQLIALAKSALPVMAIGLAAFAGGSGGDAL